MSIQLPIVEKLSLQPKLRACIDALPKTNRVKRVPYGLLYADLDDSYIHKVFEVIQSNELEKPDYFSEDTHFIGAHISIIYPEENATAPNLPSTSIDFKIEGLFRADFKEKKYYALKVSSTFICQFRAKNNLPEKLILNGFPIDPHITVAVSKKLANAL